MVQSHAATENTHGFCSHPTSLIAQIQKEGEARAMQTH